VLGITGGVHWLAFSSGDYTLSSLGQCLRPSPRFVAIGFTVPLLFANTLFGPRSSAYGGDTLGLLLASVIAGTLGVTTLGVTNTTQ